MNKRIKPKAKPKAKATVETGKKQAKPNRTGSATEIFMKWKVSEALELLESLHIKEYAKANPEKTFGDVFGEMFAEIVKEVEDHPEKYYNLTEEQIKIIKGGK